MTTTTTRPTVLVNGNPQPARYVAERLGACCRCGHRYFADRPTTAPCWHCRDRKSQ